MIKKWRKDEKGGFTIFSVVMMLGIMILAGLFINVIFTQMSINFSKTAMDDATRVRALATDIPIKESRGVLEVVHGDYSASNAYNTRPTRDAMGRSVPTTNSNEYQNTVNFAEDSGRESMINSVDSILGNNIAGNKIIDIEGANICFDVVQLEAGESNVTFSCNLQTPSGESATVELDTVVRGYTDVDGINEYMDDTLDDSLHVGSVVFGAAVVEPRSLITRGLDTLGLRDEPQIVLYSVAYPQLDNCYGAYCMN